MLPLPSTSPAPSWLAELGWADRFELLERIGSGGMGQVWRARERDTDRIVALKTLDPSKSGDDHLLARLDIEAATLIKLRDAGQHEHIVPIIDFKVSDTHACLVMEFIPGLNLRKWCDTHQLGLTKRVELIAQVARATGWFHALDVIHRDLKPANILVNAVTHQPVIVDFSIAKLDDTLPLTLTNEALGTAPYMAPEQLDRTRSDIIPATDVYALGVTLYELLTHVLPHPGELPQIIQRHQDEVRPARPSLINKDVPRDLESICLQALSSRPIQRYADGIGLAEDLDRYLAGHPVVARPLSTFALVVRQMKRRPLLAFSLLALSITLIISALSIHRLHREARIREIESAMQSLRDTHEWNAISLKQLDTLLIDFRQLSPHQAAVLDSSAVQTVIRDTEQLLRETYPPLEKLVSAEQAVIPWLRIASPAEAIRLMDLLQKKRSRWKVDIRLTAPFEAASSLLGKNKVRIDGRNLFPLDSLYENGSKPQAFASINVPLNLLVPFRADFVVVGRSKAITSFGLSLLSPQGNTRTIVYGVKAAPPEVIARLADTPMQSDGFVMTIWRSSFLEAARYVPRPVVIRANPPDYEFPLGITVEVHPGHLEVSVGGTSSVRLESNFTCMIATKAPSCTLEWGKEMAMRQMTINRPLSGMGTAIERGDLYLISGSFRSAVGAYGEAFGDPDHDQEARYKCGAAYWLAGQHGAAMEYWESVSHSASSIWQELSLYQLWYHTVVQQGVPAASRYLKLMPLPEAQSIRFRTLLQHKEQIEILAAYERHRIEEPLSAVDLELVKKVLGTKASP